MFLGEFSGNGKKALHVVFKKLDKNSQQAFPVFWSMSREKNKKRRAATYKIWFLLGLMEYASTCLVTVLSAWVKQHSELRVT